MSVLMEEDIEINPRGTIFMHPIVSIICMVYAFVKYYFTRKDEKYLPIFAFVNIVFYYATWWLFLCARGPFGFFGGLTYFGLQIFETVYALFRRKWADRKHYKRQILFAQLGLNFLNIIFVMLWSAMRWRVIYALSRYDRVETCYTFFSAFKSSDPGDGAVGQY